MLKSGTGKIQTSWLPMVHLGVLTKTNMNLGDPLMMGKKQGRMNVDKVTSTEEDRQQKGRKYDTGD